MPAPANPSVIARFAPSPTGQLHIGGARTALFSWAVSRQARGAFILRIEDTDRARSSDGATRRIIEDLAWLGIDWDEGPAHPHEGRVIGGDPRRVGPFEQSARHAQGIYNRWCGVLLDQEKAYHAFESSDQLEAMRQRAVREKKQFRYDRSGLSVPKAERFRRADAGEPHVVRLRMPDGAIAFDDVIRGHIVIQPTELDDFVIRKADGWPTYHMGVVVDDEMMGVTHVVRGEEHLANTPRHVALQRALGFRTPVYAHLPLIFNPDGSKMSKRDKDRAAREACKTAGLTDSPVEIIPPDVYRDWLGDTARQLAQDQLSALAERIDVALPEVEVDDFRRAGYLPETLCNFISLCGWSPGDDVEKFDRAFLVERFSLSRIVKAPARFDRKKLLSFNADAIGAMTDGEFARRWTDWCLRYDPAIVESLDPGRFTVLAAALRPRVKTLREAAVSARFAIVGADAIHYDAKAVEKNLTKNDGEGVRALREIRAPLASLSPFDAPHVHALVEAFAAERSMNMGRIAQPLRVALTGGVISPPIDATVAVLGREEAIRRIDRCLAACAP